MSARGCVRALALLPVLTLTGCNDDPECSLDAVLAGGYDGTLAWDLAGENDCGFADASPVQPGLLAVSFVDTAAGVPQNLSIVPVTSTLTIGTFPAEVFFRVSNTVWESGSNNCQVTFTNFTPENWSVVDFYDIEGALQCTGPLTADGSDPVTVTGAITFSAHIHETVRSYGIF